MGPTGGPARDRAPGSGPTGSWASGSGGGGPGLSGVAPTLGPVTDPDVRAAPALSPSRAADFRTCPLLYRFRAVDRLPETPSAAALRGTLVHAVLERVFDLPAADRVPAAAHDLVAPAWAAVREAEPLAAVPEDAPAWWASVGALLERWFTLEDPRVLEPAGRELRVRAELPAAQGPVPLKGIVDRLDVDAAGRTAVVDYKTGSAPGAAGEARALFGVTFYALVLLLRDGRAPDELRLLHLGDGSTWTYRPDADDLTRFARIPAAVWAAVRAAAPTGDFRPRPGRPCDWCAHRALCPAWGGTPPPYPGWPGDDSA